MFKSFSKLTDSYLKIRLIRKIVSLDYKLKLK